MGRILPFRRPERRPRQRRRWRVPVVRLVIVLAVLVLILPQAAMAVNALVKTHPGCRVWSVVDGDTVRMVCPSIGATTGRIIGYDTPETNGDCLREKAMAARATLELTRLLLLGREIDARVDGMDRYGRHLVVLIIDGDGVAGRMVEAGLARWYDGGIRPSWCND